jgi:hypothetical protein
MAFASHLASVAITGASTGMTTESMTLVSGNTFKIDDAAKEVWDPDVAMSFFENGIAASTPIIGVDALNGTVTFGSAPTTPITVTGSYLPRTVIAQAYAYTANMNRDLIEKTVFGDTVKKKIPGLLDASGDLRIRDLQDTVVSGGDTLKDIFNSGAEYVISFLASASSNPWRVRAVCESTVLDASIDGQFDNTVSWQLAGKDNVEGWEVYLSAE